MPIYTIETSYRLPVHRHRNYEADTVEETCCLAMEDDDWSGEKPDTESAGAIYVSGVWYGAAAPHRGAALPFPSEFDEVVQRKADHFEILLGVLKILAHVPDLRAPELPFWLPRAQGAIATAEAILAIGCDPECPASD